MRAIFIFALALLPFFVMAKDVPDAKIKQSIIKQSIAEYSGSCACPYQTDRAGRSCGRRSAYSKPGGEAPICYEKDVTKEMIDEWKRSQS